jgi:hypothetical protein
VPPGLGVLTSDHLLPFQWKASFRIRLELVSGLVPASPAAMQLAADRQRTEKSSFKWLTLKPAGLARRALDLLPFQCRCYA